MTMAGFQEFSVTVSLELEVFTDRVADRRRCVRAGRYRAVSILFISERESTSEGSNSGYGLPGERAGCQKNCTSRLNWHLC